MGYEERQGGNDDKAQSWRFLKVRSNKFMKKWTRGAKRKPTEVLVKRNKVKRKRIRK